MTAELTAVGDARRCSCRCPARPATTRPRNAEALAAAGRRGRWCPTPSSTPPASTRELGALLADPARLAAMSAAARTLGRPDATARFADLVEEVGRCPRGAPSTSTSSTPRAVHIVGVGGAGMSAIATVLARMGHRVSGSDLRDSRALERLRPARRRPRTSGTTPATCPTALDAVVDLDRDPREQPRGRRPRASAGCPVLRRADALRAIVATRTRSRSPGATARPRRRRCSRSSCAPPGWHPSFLIGGDLNEVGTNAVFDDGEWLVVEADESDGTFLELAPDAAIVTNVVPDHLDHYGDFAALVEAFETLRRPASRACASLCADDDVAAAIARRCAPGTTSSRTGSPTTPTTA